MIVSSFPLTDSNKLEAYNLETESFSVVIDDPAYLVGSFDIYQNFVVWSQAYTGTVDYDVMGYDLISQQTFTISDKPGDEIAVKIDDNQVIWEWNGGLYGYNLTSNEYMTITVEAHTRLDRELSGDWLVWRDDRHGEWDIYAMNIRTGQEYRVTEETDLYYNPEIDDSLIMWTVGESPSRPYLAIDIEAVRRLDHFSFLPLISR
jgi:hypothetical protein